MSTLKPYLVDVPVLLIFFARPEVLEKTFQSIRDARPSKLYLCQDGPRPGRKDDVDNILKCREIIKNIDWECEVYTKYSDKNLGCDPNIYSAISWVFENEETMIMIEDDGCVHPDFFRFCKEMFEKYKNDERVALVSSSNLIGECECPHSYFFSNSGTLWGGWGMWKRSWDLRDDNLDYVNDEYSMNMLKGSFTNKVIIKDFIKSSIFRKEERDREKKVTSFEMIVGSARLLQSSVAIVPTKNMLCNLGISNNSTHSVNNKRLLPKAIQNIFFMETYPMDKTIIHPKYMIVNNSYDIDVHKIIVPNNIIKFKRRIESLIRRVIFR